MGADPRTPDKLSGALARPLTRRQALQGMAFAGAAAFLAACGANTATTAPTAAPTAAPTTPPTAAPTAAATAAATAAPTAAATAAPTAAATAAPTAAATAAPTAAPSASTGGKAGGSLNILVQDAIGTSQGQFDPRRGTDQSAFFVKAHVFRTILDADPLTGNVTPVLAADIPTQEDDKTWLLKLKPGIPFHDGSVLKASDVKYTVESINSKELNSLYNNVYNFIDSMDVVDDNTIRFHLKSPFGAFLERLASLAPVPQAVAEAKGLDEFGRSPVGTGPYVFGSFPPDGDLKLTRFDGYTLGAPALLDELVWKRILEGSSRIAALQSGEADVVLHVPPDLYSVVGTGGIVTGKTDGTAYDAILYNNSKDPFTNKLTRQAIAYGINRDDYNQASWGGLSTPTFSPLPSWHWAYNANGLQFKTDADKAKALLTQAGLTQPVSFELMGATAQTQLVGVTVLQGQLQKAGFDPQLKIGDGDAMYSFVFDHTFQSYNFYGDTGLLGMDPDIWYRWLYYGTFTNAPAAETKAMQQKIDAAATIAASEVDKRKAAYADLQDFLMEQQQITHISSRPVLNAWLDSISGFAPRYNNIPDFSVVSKG